MKLIGDVSWYIKEKPERFDPLTAKEGDVFFKDGRPFIKYIFKRLVGAFIEFEDEQKLYSSHLSNIGIFVKDNLENLNLKTSIGLEVHPDMPIIAIPEVLQDFIPKGYTVKVSWTSYIYGIDTEVISHKLIVGDTGPANRFIKSWKEENGVVTVDGRIGDLPSGIFLEYASLNVGILKNVEIELL